MSAFKTPAVRVIVPGTSALPSAGKRTVTFAPGVAWAAATSGTSTKTRTVSSRATVNSVSDRFAPGCRKCPVWTYRPVTTPA